MSKELSPIETEAMEWIQRESSILITRIPDKSETDCLGTRTPGRATFARLEKLGLVYETDEDPIFPEDGPDSDTWTPSIELTDAGRIWKPKPFSATPARPRPPR